MTKRVSIGNGNGNGNGNECVQDAQLDPIALSASGDAALGSEKGGAIGGGINTHRIQQH